MRKHHPPIAEVPEEIVIPLVVRREQLTIVAPPPALSSQHNCGHVGLTRSGFLEEVRRMRRDPAYAPHIIVRGKDRIVETAILVAWLKSQAPSATGSSRATDGGVDGVLAAVGLKRVAG